MWSAVTIAAIILAIAAVAIDVSMRTGSHTTSTQSPYAFVTIVNSTQSNPGVFAFVPSTIIVVLGVNNTVIWKNNDTIYHTVTSYNGTFDSGLLAGGASWNFTFTKPGTYPYHCKLHLFMTGSVIVVSG
ncbi:MAG TPA: cupredoxin domain-containing protein [Nitrososphaerales archaeon]|nr:cupredoxin domain-containing protein [Nitrososphaerales archaeon]